MTRFVKLDVKGCDPLTSALGACSLGLGIYILVVYIQQNEDNGVGKASPDDTEHEECTRA